METLDFGRLGRDGIRALSRPSWWPTTYGTGNIPRIRLEGSMPAGTKFGWDYGARREKGYRGSVWRAQIRVGLGPVGINAPIKVPSGSGSRVLYTVQVPLRDGVDLASRGRPKSKRRNIQYVGTPMIRTSMSYRFCYCRMLRIFVYLV